MSKRSNACEFSQKERQAIIERDGDCIFCRMAYAPHYEAGWGLSVAHYVPRSHGGLGIRQNGVLACQYHHSIMDNGNDGRREEMLGIVRDYLKSFYPEWNEEDLVYDKWRFLK